MSTDGTFDDGDSDSGRGGPPIWAVILTLLVVLGFIGVLVALGLDLADLAGVVAGTAVIVSGAYKLLVMAAQRQRRRRSPLGQVKEDVDRTEENREKQI